jgi:hypothetical protein
MGAHAQEGGKGSDFVDLFGNFAQMGINLRLL